MGGFRLESCPETTEPHGPILWKLDSWTHSQNVVEYLELLGISVQIPVLATTRTKMQLHTTSSLVQSRWTACALLSLGSARGNSTGIPMRKRDVGKSRDS